MRYFKKPSIWLAATVVGVTLLQYQNCGSSNGGGGTAATETATSTTVILSPSTTSPAVSAPVTISVQVTSPDSATDVIIGSVSGGTQTAFASCILDNISSTGSCVYTPSAAGIVNLYVSVTDTTGNVLQTCTTASGSNCEGTYQLNVGGATATPAPSATPSGCVNPVCNPGEPCPQYRCPVGGTPHI